MPIYKKIIQSNNDRKFSDWEAPKMSNYRLQCCDCGLVHDIQFKVLTAKSRRIDGRTAQIQIRFRFNKISTEQVRKARNIKMNLKGIK